MKKTLLIMVMALAVLLTQCRKPEVKFPSPVAPEGTTVSMTVTAGPGSKTDITTAGGITWSVGDKLYVGYDSKYVGYLTLVSGSGTPTGTFSGNVTLPNGTTGENEFGFFYLGSDNSVAPTYGAESVDVSFATQEIYANGTNLSDDAKKFHVGYGSAKGTVKDGVVTGINVTLVSKVALARFSFKKNSTDYKDELTLSGTNIYNEMTVNFNGSFDHGATPGNITLTAGHGERYVMLVPTGDATEQTLTFACGSEVGGGKVPGLQSNKFYGKSDAIAVSLHEYVDLGLSVKWATCNLGATNGATAESWYGDYYAWGETSAKSDYTWSTYKWCNGSNTTLTKYCTDSNYGTVDNKTVLDPEDDAAHVNWGGGWRMPTWEEWDELIDSTNPAWTDDYDNTGVAGTVFTSKSNGKTLFVPAAGYRYETVREGEGEYDLLWSTALSPASPDQGVRMYGFEWVSWNQTGFTDRYVGCAVRPVQ